MKQKSLVGLKAIDIVQILSDDGVMEITYHGTPQCLVIPVPRNVRDLYTALERIKSELFPQKE